MNKKFAAQWIWGKDTPQNNAANTWMIFRKKATLNKRPERAEAFIAADSKYWLYINGKLAVFEGGLKRGPSRTDTYADKADIAKYLTEGENTIAALVVFFGVREGRAGERPPESYSDNTSGKGGFMFEACLDGEKLVSDGSWRCARHAGYIKPATAPNYRLPEPDLNYDAAEALPFEEWFLPEFDDGAWEYAHEMGTPPTPPWNSLWERPIPLWKTGEIVKLPPTNSSVRAEKTNGGTRYILRLPTNLQVTPYFKLCAERAGAIVNIKTPNSDFVDANRARYSTKKGAQEYESLLWLAGWEIIFEFPEGCEVQELGYRASGYNTEFRGSFVSDDMFLNTLWEKSRDTLYVTMRDGFMDCPDRERASWWGDAVIESEMAYYALDEKAHMLIKKGICNVNEWSRGGVRVTVPVCREWFELPVQSLAGITGDWRHYMYTGDKSVLATTYELNKNYLLASFDMADNGLVKHRGGSWDWADWGENADFSVLDNEWYYAALTCALKAAEALDKSADAELFARKRSIEENFDKRFWRGTAYRSEDVSIPDDRANAMAVFVGLAGQSRYPSIKNVLQSSKFASPYMEKYVLEALFMMGCAEDAVSRMKERYAGMTESGIPTLWELFSLDGGSANHAWSGGPLTLMSKYIAGVSPLEAGYEKALVRPQTAGLDKIDAIVPTVKGDIVLHMDETDGLKMHVELPQKMKALIAVPSKGRAVSINGQNAKEKVRFVKNDGFYTYYEADAGVWSFEA